MKGLKYYLLILGGWFALILGVIGIFIPVLPTTPLLLLAAACFARGSEPLHRWLLGNRWFGTYIRDYREGRGVSWQHKAATLLLLWLSIGYTALFIVRPLWLQLLLLGIALAVTAHLMILKTRR